VYGAGALVLSGFVAVGSFVWTGNLLLVWSLLNARILQALGRAWAAVAWLAAGLAITCAAAIALVVGGGAVAGLALMCGTAVSAAGSFVAARVAVRRPDDALLTA
jgi:hypothetical protein